MSQDIGQDKQIQRTGGTAVQEAKPKLKKPKLYKVLLLNDDYTPMEFVVIVLERFFKLQREQAVRIMLTCIKKGRAYAAYTRMKSLK